MEASTATATATATATDPIVTDLVHANHILAREGVVDAYGHVSVRHPQRPDRFLLSRSRSPELVQEADIIEYRLDGSPVDDRGRPSYMERFIHGAIYEARPDVQSVVHSHADEVLPFSISDVPLRAVLHVASDMGAHVPVWDIADRFGDTNLLVTSQAQGRDLAGTLQGDTVVLMRGHGFSVAARTLFDAVRIAVYLPRNARVQMEALRLGGKVKYLSEGEIAVRGAMDPKAASVKRAWDYWVSRSIGCTCGQSHQSGATADSDSTTSTSNEETA